MHIVFNIYDCDICMQAKQIIDKLMLISFLSWSIIKVIIGHIMS